jgi:hypothetical protein
MMHELIIQNMDSQAGLKKQEKLEPSGAVISYRKIEKYSHHVAEAGMLRFINTSKIILKFFIFFQISIFSSM